MSHYDRNSSLSQVENSGSSLSFRREPVETPVSTLFFCLSVSILTFLNVYQPSPTELPAIEDFYFSNIISPYAQKEADAFQNSLSNFIQNYRSDLSVELDSIRRTQQNITKQMVDVDRLAHLTLGATQARVARIQSDLYTLRGIKPLAEISSKTQESLNRVMDSLLSIDSMLPPHERLYPKMSPHKKHYANLHRYMQKYSASSLKTERRARKRSVRRTSSNSTQGFIRIPMFGHEFGDNESVVSMGSSNGSKSSESIFQRNKSNLTDTPNQQLVDDIEIETVQPPKKQSDQETEDSLIVSVHQNDDETISDIGFESITIAPKVPTMPVQNLQSSQDSIEKSSLKTLATSIDKPGESSVIISEANCDSLKPDAFSTNDVTGNDNGNPPATNSLVAGLQNELQEIGESDSSRDKLPKDPNSNQEAMIPQDLDSNLHETSESLDNKFDKLSLKSDTFEEDDGHNIKDSENIQDIVDLVQDEFSQSVTANDDDLTEHNSAASPGIQSAKSVSISDPNEIEGLESIVSNTQKEVDEEESPFDKDSSVVVDNLEPEGSKDFHDGIHEAQSHKSTEGRIEVNSTNQETNMEQPPLPIKANENMASPDSPSSEIDQPAPDFYLFQQPETTPVSATTIDVIVSPVAEPTTNITGNSQSLGSSFLAGPPSFRIKQMWPWSGNDSDTSSATEHSYSKEPSVRRSFSLPSAIILNEPSGSSQDQSSALKSLQSIMNKDNSKKGK